MRDAGSHRGKSAKAPLSYRQGLNYVFVGEAQSSSMMESRHPSLEVTPSDIVRNVNVLNYAALERR